MRARTLLALGLGLSLALPGALRADDPATPETGGGAATEGGDKKPAPKPPKTVEAKRAPFTVTLEVKGTFEPRSPVEVAYKPQTWGGELEVVEAAPQGPVTEGQTLVRFKTEKIDEAIETAEADLKIARSALAKTMEDAKRQEEASKVALLRGEREKRLADEALRRFQEVEMPLRKSEYEHSMQGTENWITDQKEELAQLEKMYKADDLTEETEEIVLKRSRRNLERSLRSQAFQKQRHKLFLEVELPDELDGLVLNQRREANEWDRLQATSSLALDQTRLEQAKAKLNLARQEQALVKLKADREAHVIKSPAAGVAVPGAFAKGKWGNLDDMTRALKPGQKVPAHQPIYTVYQAGPMSIRSSVAEADVLKVKEGLTGTAKAAAMPDRPFTARVAKVARLSDDGNFDVVLEPEKMPDALMPGFQVKVVLDLEKKDAAITVPDGALTKDGEKSSVHVWADGEAKAREVKVGASSGGRTEVLEGLQPGDLVLESAPKK